MSDLLVDAGRELLCRPLLAHAMLQSNNATSRSRGVPSPRCSSELILETLGIAEPDEDLARLVRIVEAAWYGIIISALNHHITLEQCDADTRLCLPSTPQRHLSGPPLRQ